jgi:hypothetical protein
MEAAFRAYLNAVDRAEALHHNLYLKGIVWMNAASRADDERARAFAAYDKFQPERDATKRLHFENAMELAYKERTAFRHDMY